MSEIRFGCGEFVPGTKRVPPPPPGGGDPPDIIAVDPRIVIPPRTIPPPPVEDFWACICTEVNTPLPPGDPGNTTTCDINTRRCVLESTIPVGSNRSGQSFRTKQECENVGFGEEPCSIILFKCYEYEKYCPEIQEYIWTKACVNCKNPVTGGNRFPNPIFANGCIHPSIIECERQEECYDVECPPDFRRTRDRDLSGPGGFLRPGTPNTPPPPGVLGPTTPSGQRRTAMWRCTDILEYCPPPYQNNVRTRRKGCIQDRNPPANPGRDYFDTEAQCRAQCYGPPSSTPCPTDTTIPGDTTTTISIPFPGGPDELPGPEPINRTGANNRFGRAPGGPIVLNNGGGATTTSQRLPGGPIRDEDSFTPTTGIEPNRGTGGDTTFIRLPGGPVRDEDRFTGPAIVEQNRRNSFFSDPTLEALNRSIQNATIDNAKMFDVIDVEDLYISKFSDQSTSSSGDLYHPIYNIFNYEDSKIDEGQFVQNDKNRNVFADLVSPVVKYFLDHKNTNIEWSDKFAVGLSKTRIIKSLRVDVYNTFKSILDIDGQPINVDFFLNMIKRHLVFGTIDDLNMSYFANLKNIQKERKRLELKKSPNSELNHRAALGLIASRGFSLDVNKYSQLQDKIEIARQRFLLTDLEASVPVETLDGVSHTVLLEEAGVSVSSLDSSEEFVPLGPGDGYYFVIETLEGKEIPLEIDTAVSATFAAPASVRKIALEMIDEIPYMFFSTSSSFEDSEFGPGYASSYQVSANYYKLDQTSLREVATTNNLVSVTEAKYILLTDDAEIYEHSKTFGAKATQFNLQYDDPFIRYAERSNGFTMSQRDITFRNFEISRSSGEYSKLARSIPQAIIIAPTNKTEKNPFYAYSTLDTVTDNLVNRSILGMPSFSLTKEQESRRAIPNKLTAVEENTYQIGLVGIKDTQNIYYPFDKSVYEESFVVSKRSPVGHVYYDLLENTIKLKYNFSYLTWWDIFKRLKLTEFTSFIYSAPENLLRNLEKGFKGYKVKSVLQRDSAIPSVLQLKDSQIQEDIILTDSVRYKPRKTID